MLIGPGGGQSACPVPANIAMWSRGNVVVDDPKGEGVAMCGPARAARGERVVEIGDGDGCVGVNPLAMIAMNASDPTIVLLQLKAVCRALGIDPDMGPVEHVAEWALVLAAMRRYLRFFAGGSGVVMPTIGAVVQDACRDVADNPASLDEIREEVGLSRGWGAPAFADMTVGEREQVRARILAAVPGYDRPEIKRLLSVRDAKDLIEINKGKASAFVRISLATSAMAPWAKDLVFWTLFQAVGHSKGGEDGDTLVVLPYVETVNLPRLHVHAKLPGATLLAVTDSLQRLEGVYGPIGKHCLIKDSDVFAAAAIRSLEDAEALSKMLGDTAVEVVSHTRNGCGQSHPSVAMHRRPLLSPKEIIRAAPGIMIVKPRKRHPVLAWLLGPNQRPTVRFIPAGSAAKR